MNSVESNVLIYYDADTKKIDTIAESTNEKTKIIRILAIFITLLGAGFSGILYGIPSLASMFDYVIVWNTILPQLDVMIIGITGTICLILACISILNLNNQALTACSERKRLIQNIYMVVLMILTFSIYLLLFGIQLKYIADHDNLLLIYYTVIDSSNITDFYCIYFLIADLFVCIGTFMLYIYFYILYHNAIDACEIYNPNTAQSVLVADKINASCNLDQSLYVCQITLDQLNQLRPQPK